MNTLTDYRTFLESCQCLTDGFFATSSEAAWRLGNVLHARCDDRFAAVRKAPVQCSRYEFEGLWALPGGMVRVSGGQRGCDEALRFAVEDRAVREAGILTGDCSEYLPAAHLGPVVTSYTAKGLRRHTLVTAITCSVSAASDLSAGDHSVDAACWMEMPPKWSTFAPANRLILGHLAWDALSMTQQDQATEPLLAAIAQCAEWADEIDLAPAAAPWADRDDLSKWRLAWP